MGLHSSQYLRSDNVVGPADVEVEVFDGRVVEVPFHQFLSREFNDWVLSVYIGRGVPLTFMMILVMLGFLFLDFLSRSESMYLPLNYYSVRDWVVI